MNPLQSGKKQGVQQLQKGKMELKQTLKCRIAIIGYCKYKLFINAVKPRN